MTSEIKLYGAEYCHKTQHYIRLFKTKMVSFKFLDVTENQAHAEELKGLYQNNRLNFPTILIGDKKLRNPKDEELEKWLNKLEA